MPRSASARRVVQRARRAAPEGEYAPKRVSAEGSQVSKPLNPTGKKHRFGKAWMHEHVTDHWVQEAKRRGYRSRAAFKLLEIGKKDRLFRPGIRAVDLGAAPGSWSQVLAEKLGPKATIVAIDLLPMEPVRGVAAIVGDFSSDEGLAAVEAALGGAKVDLVV